MVCSAAVPPIPRAIQACALSALLLAACGDDGSHRDTAGNTYFRFVAPIQFSQCDLDLDFRCNEADDMVIVPSQCDETHIWNAGDAIEGEMDWPPGTCTVSVTIQTDETTCSGFETFQVDLNSQAMVDLTVSCEQQAARPGAANLYDRSSPALTDTRGWPTARTALHLARTRPRRARGGRSGCRPAPR